MRVTITAVLGLLSGSLGQAAITEASAESNASARDLALAPVFAAREADWRVGPMIYQVLVDRFAPSDHLDDKRDLYAPPRQLREWNELPTPGHEVPEAGVWSHELDFWGGDLASVASHMDYIQDLGMDVVYLNPIHQAYTNHKYDAQDYFAISSEFGTRDDLIRLADDLHARSMRLVMDGVFNHMGRTSPWFQEAMASPESQWRDWFYIGSQYDLGYRAWWNVPNLPELNWENPEVRNRIYNDEDSVIQGYLRDGVDGWRLDVAFDLGFQILRELTDAAHRARPDSEVIGEIWNDPEEWLASVDGTMNMPMRRLILEHVSGEISGRQAGDILERMVDDCDYEGLLRSWVILDNHDVPRLATTIPDEAERHMAQILQFTLPGAPCVYYGVELGMAGGGDPENRAPMRWDLVNDDNADLNWTRGLIAARKDCRSLRIGNFRRLDSERLLAFTRYTDHVNDLAAVFVNSTDEPISEIVYLRDSKIMSNTPMVDVFTGAEFSTQAGAVSITVPPQTAYLLRPRTETGTDYTPFKRVQ